MLKVGIVVLNWKQSKLTVKVVQELSRLNHPNFSYHIVIVDNASPDESFIIFQKYFQSKKTITLIKNSANTGYTGGNNTGIQFFLDQDYDYILLINNDVTVDRNFLAQLVHSLKEFPKVAAVTPKIYFSAGFEYHHDRYTNQELGKVIWAAGGQIDWANIYGSNIGIDQVDTGQFEHSNNSIDFVSGCCCLIRSTALKQVGLLDQRYFMYLEDADLSQRLIRSGWQILYQPKSIIWHQNAGSSSAGGPLQQYFLTRNRLLFGFLYANTKTKFALLRQSIKELFFSPYPWIKTGIKDFFFQKWNQGSWQ